MRSGVRLMMQVALVLLLAGLVKAPAWAAEKVIVKLKATAAIDHGTVVLADFAQVSGASSGTLGKLQALDLAELAEEGSSETITARHVQARLLLEGIDPRNVTLAGATESKVVRSATAAAAAAVHNQPVAYQEDVLAQLTAALAKAWLAPAEDLDIQLVASKTGLATTTGSTAAPTLELPTRLEPGRIQARILWMSQGKLERVEPVTFEVKLRQTVVLATHKIERGVPLKPQDVVEDRRLLTTRIEQIRAEQVVGYASRRGLSQGEQLDSKDLATVRTGPVIKAQNGVKVVARKGSLAVTLQMAKALESGNVGDVIRLQNLQSGQIISGRVVSSQLVEIPLD